MVNLHDIFEITVSENKLEAVIKQYKSFPEDLKTEELTEFLRECGITYGIIDENISSLLSGKESLPLVVAKGKAPVNGENAYIFSMLDEVSETSGSSPDPEEDVDLKNVISIPSVEAGTVVGKKIDATKEFNGISVYGREIAARPGRDIKLRPGKNTRVEGSDIIATVDGQVSVQPKVIHVFPVYEVNGDMDLKTGNLDFIGNVNIRGNVPAGFEIKAKGDIRVHGSVESAYLIAGGSVFIHQGVVAQGGGLIKAERDLQTSFLNQANIKVGGDIHVTKTILHSKAEAQGYVFCKQGRGNIVGGAVSAGKGIEVNEAGNQMSTPTALYLGISEQAVEDGQKYRKQVSVSQENTQKLAILLKKIIAKEKKDGLSAKEKITKLRIKKSLQEANNQLNDAKDRLLDLHDIFENQNEAQIRIYKNIHPNTDLYFGKYRKKIVTEHKRVLFRIDRSEIKFEPL